MMAYQNQRVGIIGGGWIARVHVPAIDAAPGIELVAACDVAHERAEAITAGRDARAYTRWEEMLEREQLDLLWVCTPPLFHRAPVEAALAAGIHVYLEKPIARTLDDADAIVSAAEASSAICAVGYQWHASSELASALTVLAGQEVGLIVGRNFGPTAGRPWFMDRAQGGGQILERGSHHIDLQRALAGEIAWVAAAAGTVDLSKADAPSGIEDAVSLTFGFASGALGQVHLAWTRPGQLELYGVDVVASDATLALQLGPEAFRLVGRSRDETIEITGSEPMDLSIARFLEAVRQGDKDLVPCLPADARATLAVAVACEQALASGSRVTVAS
jgi:predicted dehydrogenase